MNRVNGVNRVNVVFTPSGMKVRVAKGVTVLDAARAIGVDIDSVCGGRGICGRCQIAPVNGQLPKWGITSEANSLSEPETTERNYSNRRRPLKTGMRLGCQAKIHNDIVIDVPASSQIHRPVVSKNIALGKIDTNPSITLHYVETSPDVLGDETSDTTRVADALKREWGLTNIDFHISTLPQLHKALKQGGHAVTVAIYNGKHVIGVRPGYVDAVYGVAVDVGSTTLASYLVDIASGEVLATAGRMNPQIRFGEDLMSRVSYVMLNLEGRSKLTKVIRDAINDLVDELRETTDIAREHIHHMVIVGNPVMHHLVLGIDPTALGVAPFTLTTSSAVQGRATDIDVNLHNAVLYVAPCIAGHVGADAAAMIIAEEPYRSSSSVLLVDVGTNAEIVLGCGEGERLFAASSPTGPAFEGAQISCGQRATSGAIERVRINKETLEPRFKVIGCDLWSDDPGFERHIVDAGIEVSGLCGSGIIEVVAEMFLAGIIDSGGTILPSTILPSTTPSDATLIGDTSSGLNTNTDNGSRIVADGRTFSYVLREHPRKLMVTQNDVRAIQLAKAALRAGIDLLCEHAGIDSLQNIRLTGAFGAHIDPLYAMVLGLIPDAPVESVHPVGNASGVGAVRMLLSKSCRDKVEEVVRKVEKIETATESRFQEMFISAMAFPHANASYPHLSKSVQLPAKRSTTLQTTKKARIKRRRAPGSRKAPDRAYKPPS